MIHTVTSGFLIRSGDGALYFCLTHAASSSSTSVLNSFLPSMRPAIPAGHSGRLLTASGRGAAGPSRDQLDLSAGGASHRAGLWPPPGILRRLSQYLSLGEPSKLSLYGDHGRGRRARPVSTRPANTGDSHHPRYERRTSRTGQDRETL